MFASILFLLYKFKEPQAKFPPQPITNFLSINIFHEKHPPPFFLFSFKGKIILFHVVCLNLGGVRCVCVFFWDSKSFVNDVIYMKMSHKCLFRYKRKRQFHFYFCVSQKYLLFFWNGIWKIFLSVFKFITWLCGYIYLFLSWWDVWESKRFTFYLPNRKFCMFAFVLCWLFKRGFFSEYLYLLNDKMIWYPGIYLTFYLHKIYKITI